MTTAEDAEALITADELTQFHDEVIARYSGRPGILHPNCVDRTIAAAWHAEEYEGSSLPGLVLAGYLLYYLATDHCFQDGNKRTAWFAGMRVLSHFDLTVEVSDDDAYLFMCECARGRTGTVPGGNYVVTWLAARVVELVQ